jgi:hypothetical protein
MQDVGGGGRGGFAFVLALAKVYHNIAARTPIELKKKFGVIKKSTVNVGQTLCIQNTLYIKHPVYKTPCMQTF